MFGHLPSPLFHASSLLPNEIARECWRLWEGDPNKSCKAMLGNQKRIERNVLASGVNLLAAEHHMHQFQFLPFAQCLRTSDSIQHLHVFSFHVKCLWVPKNYKSCSFVQARRNHCHACRSAEEFPSWSDTSGSSWSVATCSYQHATWVQRVHYEIMESSIIS